MNLLLFRFKQLLVGLYRCVSGVAQPLLSFLQHLAAKDILVERQRRALITTVDYIERHMRHVDSVRSRSALLARAFRLADASANRLILEFGVFTGGTINQLAKLTTHTVFGFDSFEGLPERWRDTCAKGLFAMPTLPRVRPNVTLVKGLFHESLPPFLAEHAGTVAFLHVDCDLCSSARVVLQLLRDRLVPGTVIVFDEYFNYPEWEQGEYRAFQEFLADTGLSFEFIGYHRTEEQVAVILRAGERPIPQA
ncbi:MAG TPA: TylF/MycF/NovP-related O-methyltransferase [Verrucomicrobiota bacterium]|nr:TylF/MycF/NovP-related O-methyltransferase [Verrucomicrobiota bacterium]HNU51906.1 TylF/MycF/NovP-related O-methyltransferase [Verrucomicrobiota bacterium]